MQYYQTDTTINKRPYIRLPFVKALDVAFELEEDNYSVIPSLLNSNELDSSEWREFQDSWNNLCQDTFMKDKGKYRYRRYSVFTWRSKHKKLIIEAKQPHYQTLDYNPLNGGIQRDFEPFEDTTISNPLFNHIMGFCILTLDQIHKDQDWHIEAHQFRIVTKPGETGLPTPEGIHRDGRDYVMMMFIGKEGIKGGETTIYDINKMPLLSRTLKHPSETVLVSDEKVMHGVSPIEPSKQSRAGIRDMLVITFYKKEKVNITSNH